jgi:hypothetical protein
MGMTRNSYIILVEKPEGKRGLGTSEHRWKASIKADFKEIGSENMGWICLAQNRM